MVAMLSKGFLITWMNLTWTPSFCSSFLIESIPSVLIKIPEAWAAFLSPITCGKYRKSNSGFVITSLNKKFEKAWMASQISRSARSYLVVIISLHLGRLRLCRKHVFILYPLWFRNITTEQKFKPTTSLPKPSTTCHCWVWTNMSCAGRLMDAARLHISSGYRKETTAKCKTAVSRRLMKVNSCYWQQNQSPKATPTRIRIFLNCIFYSLSFLLKLINNS